MKKDFSNGDYSEMKASVVKHLLAAMSRFFNKQQYNLVFCIFVNRLYPNVLRGYIVILCILKNFRPCTTSFL